MKTHTYNTHQTYHTYTRTVFIIYNTLHCTLKTEEQNTILSSSPPRLSLYADFHLAHMCKLHPTQPHPHESSKTRSKPLNERLYFSWQIRTNTFSWWCWHRGFSSAFWHCYYRSDAEHKSNWCKGDSNSFFLTQRLIVCIPCVQMKRDLNRKNSYSEGQKALSCFQDIMD